MTSSRRFQRREPRFEPAPGLSAVMLCQRGESKKGRIVNLNTNGCCVEFDSTQTIFPTGKIDLQIEKVGSGVEKKSIPSEIRERRQLLDSSTHYHVRFEKPSEIGRPDEGFVTSTTIENDSTPGGLPLDFVNNEINWRSAHVMSRTGHLLSSAKFYSVALMGLAGYVSIGFNVLKDGSFQEKYVFSSVGFAYVGLVVSLGVFLVRYAGYAFCSNIMNRKRIVMLRSSYASREVGMAGAIPPPHDPSDVWICGGYKSFPYLFAMINFAALFINVAFIYLIIEDIAFALVLATMIILVVATFYPSFCRRYHSDIFVASNFGATHPEFPDMPTQTHRQLKDLYYEVLKKREKGKWRNSEKLIVAYLAVTVIAITLGVAFCLLGENHLLLLFWPTVGLTALFRIWTMKYRTPQSVWGWLGYLLGSDS